MLVAHSHEGGKSLIHGSNLYWWRSPELTRAEQTREKSEASATTKGRLDDKDGSLQFSGFFTISMRISEWKVSQRQKHLWHKYCVNIRRYLKMQKDGFCLAFGEQNIICCSFRSLPVIKKSTEHFYRFFLVPLKLGWRSSWFHFLCASSSRFDLLSHMMMTEGQQK